MSIEKFKLAALSLDAFSDLEIEQLFLDFKIGSEGDLDKIVEILSIHRPRLLEHLTSKYCRPHATQ